MLQNDVNIIDSMSEWIIVACLGRGLICCVVQLV